MSDLPAVSTWGVVLEPVRNVLQRLKERAADGVDAMATQKVGGATPRNHDEAFLQMSLAAEAADRATRDYRSVFNAYTHKFHQPKPPIGELAAMQGAITQSFAKRYTPKTVEAIEALLSDEPDLDAIRVGIRALGFEDPRRISDPLDRAMKAAESERGFHPWLPSADKARAASRALQDLGDDEL